MRKKILCLCLSLSLLFLGGCAQKSNKQSDLVYTDTLFDTVISVQILDKANPSILKECKNLCVSYDNLFSKSNTSSEISKINNANGEPVQVSDDTISIIKDGLYYSELSNGAFDITIGTVTSLWDFQSAEHKIPEKKDIKEALKHVNYKNVAVTGNTVTLKDPDAAIDVGAIAKGYIADKLKEYLKQQGVKHALINLGGNVLALGVKPDGSDFNIGIQKPFDETGQPITSVKINDTAVVTTGIYQRYFKINDVIYHHVLDPSTGFPCDNGLSSVSIITDSSFAADSLSTTTFLLGLDKGMELINSLDHTEAIFIDHNNNLYYSKGLQ